MAIVNVLVDDLPDSDNVPAGKYDVRIEKVKEAKPDKNGDDYIGLEYTIIAGDHEGRKLFDGYIPLAGSSKLKKILKAIEFKGKTLADTDQLIGEEMTIVCKVRTSEEFGDQNSITVYLPLKKEG
jgi:hypothetical protein